jgi:adenosylcobinamide kinase / adenosylcobinamide-phosphate guanylyltransferase
MERLTLITGGVRSGKSSHAIALATASPGKRRFFVATAEARDDEMTERIARHREARSPDFETVEEPLYLGEALQKIGDRADVVVLDCLTLWVANLMDRELDDDTIGAAAAALAQSLRQAPFEAFVVTGEVGWGIVPENPAARRFRDLLGWTNQRIAQVADTVLLMAAGYPLRVK